MLGVFKRGNIMDQKRIPNMGKRAVDCLLFRCMEFYSGGSLNAKLLGAAEYRPRSFTDRVPNIDPRLGYRVLYRRLRGTKEHPVATAPVTDLTPGFRERDYRNICDCRVRSTLGYSHAVHRTARNKRRILRLRSGWHGTFLFGSSYEF